MAMVNIPDTPITCFNYCGGEWFEGRGHEFQIVSPYTGAVIGRARASVDEDLNRAVEVARVAASKWARTPIKERCAVMFRLREILLRDIKTISHRISAECGKTLGEAEAEIAKGIEVIEFASSLQNLDVGGKMEVSRGVWCEYRREPLGVVAGITPFNFPAMVPLWMLPIAITLGNAFIWKPSDKTPLTSLLIAEATREAGLPDGILSLIQGGRETVESLLAHPEIAAIGFVGSTAVAKEVYRRGSSHLKRVLALGGAKNHIILMPDADLELTGKGIADSFTGCAGQRCMAASVLVAVSGDSESEARIEKLIGAIVSSARALTLGDRMGAIISRASLENLERAIADAEKDGAKLLLDGRRKADGKDGAKVLLDGRLKVDGVSAAKNTTNESAADDEMSKAFASLSESYRNGFWLGPTILDRVQPGSRAATEELFGPVLSIIRVSSLSEALELQRSGVYGNAVSVFTQTGAVAERVAQEGKAGMVGINIGVPVPREPFSFGGVAESKFGHGDITGVHSLNFWSNPRKVTTKWAAQKDGNWMS